LKKIRAIFYFIQEHFISPMSYIHSRNFETIRESADFFFSDFIAKEIGIHGLDNIALKEEKHALVRGKQSVRLYADRKSRALPRTPLKQKKER